MAQLRMNWKLIIVLILAVVASGITMLGLRKYHRTNRAEVGLTEGTKAYQNQQWRQAAALLGQYLALHQTDVDVLLMYARSNSLIRPYKKEHASQAIRAYTTLLRNDKDNQEAARQLIDLYLQVGMPSEAESKAREFYKKTGDQQFQQSLAVSLTQQRKYKEAIEILMELISYDPNQVLAFQLLGRIAEDQPGLSKTSAQDWFDKAIEENPDSAQAYILRNAYWIRQGKIQEAHEDLENAEQCDPQDPEVRLSIAAAWIELGHLERARQQLDIVMKKDPQNEALWRMWVVYAGRTDDVEKKISIADEGLRVLGEDNFSFLPLAAETYIQTDQFDKATRCIQNLKEADVNRGIVLYLEGLLANQQMDWANAIEKWQLAIHLGYTSEAIYLNLADVLEKIHNRPMAIQLLRGYVSQREGAFRVHLILAHLFGRENRWIEALEQSTAAIQLKPSSIDGRIFYLRCRIETASTARETDITVLTGQIDQLVNAVDLIQTRLLLFEIALKQKDYIKAEKVLDEIEKIHDRNYSTILARAEIMSLQGKHEEVVKILESAHEQFPDSLEVLRGLAWSYANIQQHDKSRNLLTAFQKTLTNPGDERRIRLWLAELDLMGELPQQAYDRYIQMANDYPSDVFVRRQLLSLAKKDQSEKQLQTWIDEIKRAEGENGWQWKYEQARLWYERKDRKSYHSRIVELLQQNLVLNPDDQASRILLAAAYERAGNVQLSLSLYREALTRQPDNIDLIISAVAVMYRADEYRQAQQLLERVAQKGVHDPRLARYELQSSLRLGHVSTAVETLERIVLNAPGDKEAKLALALLHIRQNDYEQAETLIGELLQLDPDSIAANAALADLYLSQDKPEKALQVCKTYLSTHDTLQAHTMYCQLLLMMNQIPEAIKEIQIIETMVGQDTKQLLGVSSLYLNAGEIQKSNEIIEKLTMQASEDGLVLKQAALVYLEQPAMHAKGVEMLQKALDKNPRDVQLRLYQARLLLSEATADKGKQASAILNRLVYEYPRLEMAWAMLGQWALIQNEPGMALDYLMRGLSYVPESKSLLQLKAQAEATRSPQLAIATLQQLEERFPQDSLIIIALSKSYRKAEEYSKANKLLETKLAIPAMADSVDLKKERLTALYESGRSEEASKAFEQLARQTDGDRSVLATWTGLQVKNGQWQNAIQNFQQWMQKYPEKWPATLGILLEQIIEVPDSRAVNAAELLLNDLVDQYPDVPEVNYSMAMLLHRTGRKQQAVPWYEKAIEMDSSQVIALNNLAWILCMDQSNYERALQLANRGLEIAPDYADLIDTRGIIFMKLKRFEQASDDFTKCSQIFFENDPRRTGSVYRLGKCLFELGRNEMAFMELMSAKQLNRDNHGLTEEEQKDLENMLKLIS